MQVDRQAFYKPEHIFRKVKEKINKVRKKEEPIDHLTFVPDGEPTLDINLGKEIELLKYLGIKIVVITNASLLYREDVKEDLAKADLISFKIDAVDEGIWHQINRPYGLLKLPEILKEILEFSETYNCKIITETMLIDGINDKEKEIDNIAKFLEQLNPDKAFVAIPTRPPAERWVKPAVERAVNMAYQVFSAILGEDNVECLTGYEGSGFAFTGNVEEDLLSITSVHPMRAKAVDEFLRKAGTDWNLVKNLIKEEKLIELDYNKHKFYMRKLPGRR
ncbi:MAG: radical SAM protein [Candidatus Methylarchaceae archaeon HK02M2]|nr:radical SAM protein [Candidatus Methylarchaceae archaeon HK02M2]